MYNKMRSTCFCISCKSGFASTNDVSWKALHGIPHYYTVCADKGFTAVAGYCPTCNTPLYTKLKHLIREQQFAFKRHNAKRKVKNGTSKTA